MHDSVTGIHHITAIASDPIKTVDFYVRVLGLRLVKKSVNQDDVSTYHLFFGDRTGEPGMDLTFFTFQPTFPGQRGVGQVAKISFVVPQSALQFWQQRLQKHHVQSEPIKQLFGSDRLVFFDFDHQRLELVGLPESEASNDDQLWTTDEVGSTQAIRSFYSAELQVSDLTAVEPILVNALGYTLVEQEGERRRYKIPNQQRAAELEVVVEPNGRPGSTGAGTVHHIAFRVADAAHQIKVQSAIARLGLQTTPVIDRFYFKSVYFRTPAGILFELATDGPGFTADEKETELGKKLALPPFLEARRAEIEAGLPPL